MVHLQQALQQRERPETQVTQVKLEQDAPAVLYYYCSNHSGMGGKAIVRMSDLTASRALISDSGGDIAVSGVTTTELDILDGLTASTAELNIMDGVQRPPLN